MSPTSRRTVLEIASFLASSGRVGRLMRRHNIAFRILSGESRSVDLETVEDWKCTDCYKKLKVMTTVV
jgi:hypothetical protein